MKHLLLFKFIVFTSIGFCQMPEEGKLIFKIKQEFEYLCNGSNIEHQGVKNIFKKINVNQIKQKFKNTKNNEGYNETLKRPFIELRYIYEIHYDSEVPIKKIINLFEQNEIIAYAEPVVYPILTYTPNDYNSSTQDFIDIINAPAAWNIEKGDTNVIIGILDTGTDWDHPDLIDNIKYNYNDPIDGSDNDGDGYIDNFRGWDLGVNDNDPTVQGSNHGSHVSGCAAATTDNNTGVVSPGFNCKFLPVKIADASGNLIAGYEGITYAADHGCQIINCSWGSNFSSQMGQDVVNYATINTNSIVVAGAGNDNSDEEFYPASYDNVLSVGATNASDGKASFSNYGYTLDVSAPGINIYSTNYNNNYSMNSGTSMSSPIVAGCAGIVQSYFPNLTGIQVGEKLRVSSDNINALLASIHKGKMGTGRVNLYSALNTNAPSVRMLNEIVTDQNDNTFVIGDTLNVVADFTNYIDIASNATASLSTTSSFINIIDNSFMIGNLNAFDTITNDNDPFIFEVLSGIPLNEKVQFKVDIQAGAYSFEEYFDVVLNVDYINVAINQISTTITSRGMIGYNETDQQQGYGVTFEGEALLFDAGFMIGNSLNSVSDNVRGADPQYTDEDFVSMDNVHTVSPGISDLDIKGKFNDNAAGSNKLNIFVNHSSYAWVASPYDQFVILRFVVYNQSGENLDNIHCGIFGDWDIQDYNLNKAEYDQGLKLGYAYNTEPNGLYGAIQLLSNSTPNYYAYNNDGSSGSINLYDGFSESEKFTSLSNGLIKSSAGVTDISMTMASGPFSLAHADSIIVSFAILAGKDLNEIKSSATSAQLLYDSLFYNPSSINKNNIEPIKVYPSLFNDKLYLGYNTNNISIKRIKVYDMKGNLSYCLGETNINEIDLNFLNKGAYFICIETNKGMVKKEMIIKQ